MLHRTRVLLEGSAIKEYSEGYWRDKKNDSLNSSKESEGTRLDDVARRVGRAKELPAAKGSPPFG